MVFFSHPQAGGCRTADWGEATLTSGNSQSVRQNRMNEAWARRFGTHAFFVRFANLVRHSKLVRARAAIVLAISLYAVINDRR